MKNKTVFSVFIFSIIIIFPLSGQWTKTLGLPGGNFRNFAQIADTIFAQHPAGIYFSKDSGFTWQNLLTHSSPYGGRLTTDGHSLLLGQYSSDPSTRMLRSNDAGQSWIPIPVPDTLVVYEELVVGPWIYISDYHGAFRSADNGATWEPMLPYLYHMYADGHRIYGNGGNSILVSEDYGQTWDTLTSIEKVSDIIVNDSAIIVVHYHDPNRLTVSTDYGLSWEHFFPNIPSFINIEQMVNAVWHEGELYGIWGTKIFKTSDFGKNWTEIPAPKLYYSTNGISVGGELLICGEANGIFRTADGGNTWSSTNEGLISQSANRLRSFGQALIAPGREGIYHLAADQTNWELQKVDIALPWYFFSFLDYVETGDNQIVAINDEPWFSTDGGATWEECTVDNSSFYQMNRMEIVNGKIIGWEEDNSFSLFYVSENNGQTFQTLNSLQIQHSTGILELDHDNGILYAQSFDNRLFKSTDGGDHWEVVGTTIPIELFGSSQWFGGGLFFVRDNLVFVFSRDYDSQYGIKVLFSNNLGQTWQLFDNLNSGFPWGGGIFNDLVKTGGYLIAATKTGVSYSSDGGSTWTTWNEGFGNLVASRLCIHNGQLWASMTSDGVWKRSLTDLAPLALFQPKSTTTLEVFPNPFHDRIFLKNMDEDVVADLVNTLGQVVFTGKNIEQANFLNLPPGVYFLKIKGVNGDEVSEKVVHSPK